MMNDQKIVRLAVYALTVPSLGTVHCADLKSWDRNEKRARCIEHPLSEAQVARINRHLRRTYAREYYELYKAKPGDMYPIFTTKGEAIAIAIRQWRERFPDADMLVDDDDSKRVYATREIEAIQC